MPDKDRVKECLDALKEALQRLEDAFGDQNVGEALKRYAYERYDASFPDWAQEEDEDNGDS